MTYSPADFMAADIPAYAGASAALINGNTPWAQQYARELRQIVTDYANRSERNLQSHLGPSEIGHPCHRQVAGKLALLPTLNHVTDPWPSIVGTALHGWLADALLSANTPERIRFLAEHRVTPLGFEGHPGTGDGYDADTQSVIDHKGVHIDTPIATPDGWTTMGQLQVGAQVFGAGGRTCRVTRVYPVQERDCYRIRFTDGSSLVTDDVQELPFFATGRRGPRAVPMSVETAAEHVWSRDARPQRQLRVYNGGSLDLPARDLAVHPYVLGCWLGDGGVHGGTIGSGDAELYAHIETCGYAVGPPIGVKGFSRTVYGLSTQLQRLGLQWRAGEQGRAHCRLAGHKRVPDEYLRASHDQRLALLQGLMDTDGSWNKQHKRAVFITTDKGLAESVAELVSTLGWKPHIAPHTSTGFGRTVLAYNVEFTPIELSPFRLTRKAQQVRLAGSQVARYRLVESIERTVTVPTRCIDVDSPDHLYLCGEQMLPVHNCLGRTSLRKLREHGAPRHYFVQTLLYRRGFLALGLPVRRVALVAWPRTESSLDQMYVWEHIVTDEDERFLDEVIAPELAYRKQWAAALVAGAAQLLDVPADKTDSCHFCPFYRPASARDGGPGCPGDAATP